MPGFPRRLIFDGPVSVFLSDPSKNVCNSPGSAMSASSRDGQVDEDSVQLEHKYTGCWVVITCLGHGVQKCGTSLRELVIEFG